MEVNVSFIELMTIKINFVFSQKMISTPTEPVRYSFSSQIVLNCTQALETPNRVEQDLQVCLERIKSVISGINLTFRFRFHFL